MKPIYNKVVIAGGSGYIGQVLATHFSKQGATVVILSRRPGKQKGNIYYQQWDGKTMGDWADSIEGADVLINLTGKSVDCRYTEKIRPKYFHPG